MPTVRLNLRAIVIVATPRRLCLTKRRSKGGSRLRCYSMTSLKQDNFNNGYIYDVVKKLWLRTYSFERNHENCGLVTTVMLHNVISPQNVILTTPKCNTTVLTRFKNLEFKNLLGYFLGCPYKGQTLKVLWLYY